MAKKDVDKYYASICAQWKEAKDDVVEMENSKDTLYPDNVRENILRDYESVNLTYQLLSWVMHLFNMPTNKKKLRAYKKNTKKLIAHLDPTKKMDCVLENNKNTLKHIKEEIGCGRNH